MSDSTSRSPRSRLPRWVVAWVLIAVIVHQMPLLNGDATLIVGVPVLLLYHVAYCVVLSIGLWVLVRWAWPGDLEGD